MRICPICAIVSGSWLTLFVYRAIGNAVDPALIATLMGGSAVGLTYLLDRRLPSGRSSMWFKMLTIPPLLASAYGIASMHWLVAGIGIVVALGAGAFFLRAPTHPARSAVVAEAEKRLENCC